MCKNTSGEGASSVEEIAGKRRRRYVREVRDSEQPLCPSGRVLQLATKHGPFAGVTPNRLTTTSRLRFDFATTING